MPTHDFKDIGEVLSFDILRGKITAIDSATDTCSVSVDGSSVAALLFYHCEPDSIIRDNGAIEGAAAGFAVDDEVIVMKSKVNDTIKVIAHVDGVRHCGEFVVISTPTSSTATKRAVLVWNIKDNCEEFSPRDYDDEDFQEWLSSKSLKDYLTMFGTRTLDVPPCKLAPELIDDPSTNTYYHRYTSADFRFPDSFYCGVYADIRPPTYAGVRTSSVEVSSQVSKHQLRVMHGVAIPWVFTYTDVFVDNKSEYTDVGQYEVAERAKYPEDVYVSDSNGLISAETWDVQYMTRWIDYDAEKTYRFYGPFGEIASFMEVMDYYYDETGTYGTYTSHKIDDTTIARKYRDSLDGIYSDRSIINVCAVQFVPCDHSYEVSNHELVSSTITYSPREIHVQAQCLYVPEGTTGYDWVSAGRNAEFETCVTELINLGYTLNATEGTAVFDRLYGLNLSIYG